MTVRFQFQFLFLLALQSCHAFLSPNTSKVAAFTSLTKPTATATALHLVSPDVVASTITDMNMLLAETEPWVQPLANVLDPTLNILSFAMVGLLVSYLCSY